MKTPGRRKGKRDTRSYSERRVYLIKAVSRRRKNIRKLSIEYKGSACCLCGYNRCMDALEFHHLDRRSKDFGLSARGYTRSWRSVKKELKKCILVCANCHRELHAGLAAFPSNRD